MIRLIDSSAGRARSDRAAIAIARLRAGRRRRGAEAGGAGLHARQPADLAAAAEVQERVPRHAPVRPPARRRRLRRPRRRSLRPRQRRGDRSRVPLRHHHERADRLPPLAATTRRSSSSASTACCAQTKSLARRLGAASASRAPTTSRRATPRRSARSCRAPSATGRRSTSSRSGSTTPTRCRAELVDDNRHVHRRPRHPHPHPADRLPGRRVRTARRRLRAGRQPRRRSRIEKRAGGHVVSVELLELVGDDAGADRARRRQRQQRLVPGLQHLAQVLLTCGALPGSNDATDAFD